MTHSREGGSLSTLPVVIRPGWCSSLAVGNSDI
jgi:hypothetical protein